MKRVFLSASARLGTGFGLVASSFLLSTTYSQVKAAIVNQIEPNFSFAQAQYISPASFTTDYVMAIGEPPDNNTSTTLPHASILGVAQGGNFDFYKFTTLGGKTLLDIDFSTNLDSWLELYDSSENFLAYSDDNGWDQGPNTDGSTPSQSTYYYWDSYIEQVLLPGDYYVKIGRWPNQPLDLGQAYTLQISTNSAVPAPLPLFGIAAAFGFSRQLRQRIKTASQP